jgi:hypothetical protein
MVCVLVASGGVGTEEQVMGAANLPAFADDLVSYEKALTLKRKGPESFDSGLLLFQADGYQTADGDDATINGRA